MKRKNRNWQLAFLICVAAIVVTELAMTVRLAPEISSLLTRLMPLRRYA